MRFHRILCAFIAASLFSTAFAGMHVLAAAEHDTEDVKVFYSFDSALEFSTSCAKRSDTGSIYHKDAMEIFPIENTVSASKKFSELEKGVKTTVSFDFMAKQTDHIFRMALHDGTKVYSSVYWDHAGRLLCSLNGAEPTGITATNTYSQQQTLVPYDANRWHNLSMVINPAGIYTTIDYYYDGTNIGSCETSRSETGDLDALYITSTTAGYGIADSETLDYDGSEGLYIDNLRISQGEADFYATAADAEGFVKVEFSEQLSNKNDLEQLSLINTVTGEEAAIAEIINESRTLYIIPETGLVRGNEYILDIPENFVSAGGKELCNHVVYFSSTYGTNEGSWDIVEPYVFFADFENLPLGAAERNDAVWNTVIAASTVNGVSCEAVDGNQVVRFTNADGATYLRFESSGKWADDAAYDRVVVEMDVALTETKRSADILFLVNSKTVGQCFFDSYGRFVMVSGNSFDSEEDCADAYPENHIVYELSQEAGKVYKLCAKIDKQAKTIHYYIDGVQAGTAVWEEEIENPILSAVRVKANPALQDGRAIDFDNFTVAHTKSTETVSKMRLIARDGEQWGPGAQDVASTISGGLLEFSCAIDLSSVQPEDIVISDGMDTVPVTITEQGENFVQFQLDSFLKADTAYTISVSGIHAANGIPLGDYTADFKTSGEQSVVIEDFRLENAAGGNIMNITDIQEGTEVILKAEIVNSTDNAITVRPVLTEMTDGLLAQTAEAAVDVAAGGAEAVSISLTARTGENTAISAMLTDAEYKPLCQAIQLSNMVEPEDGDWTVVYNGRIASGKSGEQVFADILLPGRTRTEIASANPLDTVLAYRGQAVTDTDGSFTIRFKLKDDAEVEGDAVSGQYKVLFASAQGAEEDTLSFSNLNDAADLTEKINAAAAGDENTAVAAIQDIITNNPDALGIRADELEQMDTEMLAELVYAYIADTGALADAKSTISLFDQCTVILLTVNGKIDNLFDYAQALALDNSKIKRLYQMDFVDAALQQELTKEMSGKAIETVDDFYEALTEQFVLNAVEHPNGTENVKTVIKELCAEIGIDAAQAANAADSVYTKLAYRTFRSYSELAAAFNSAYSDAVRVPSGGNGGNGGNGTSSGGNQVLIPSGPDLTEEEITPIPESIFDDIDNVEWAKDAIISLAEKKIISGKGENKFCPNDNITREEFTKIIVSAFLPDAPAADISFADVAQDSWASPYIAKAYGAGIISGYSASYFGAKENITRQDMATILYRAALYRGIVFGTALDKRFTDEAAIPAYALEAVNTLYNAEVISGMSEAEFGGAGFATRAQAAKMVDELLKL